MLQQLGRQVGREGPLSPRCRRGLSTAPGGGGVSTDRAQGQDGQDSGPCWVGKGPSVGKVPGLFSRHRWLLYGETRRVWIWGYSEVLGHGSGGWWVQSGDLGWLPAAPLGWASRRKRMCPAIPSSSLPPSLEATPRTAPAPLPAWLLSSRKPHHHGKEPRVPVQPP